MIFTINGIYADKWVKGETYLVNKIKKIDKIISALEDAELAVLTNGNFDPTQSEYLLDDGQTKIMIKRFTQKSIADSISAWEGVRQRYINSLNGRTVRMIDSKNFNNNGRIF